MDAAFYDRLQLRSLRLWNFLSFGPDEVFLDLSESLLSAVMGINHDTGGENSRNGTGKSALLVDAICYALFGKPLRDDIKLAHLVHKLTRKGQPMMVILEFSRGQYHYQIERGLNPSKINFFRKPIDDERDFRHQEKVDGKKVFIFDLTKRSANTTEEIERAVGFDIVLFPYLIANTSETIPFFKLEEAKRRAIIESLFGFTKLSMIAKTLKKERDTANEELIGLTSSVNATEAANERIQKQINDLESQKVQFYEGFTKQKATAEVRSRSIESSIDKVFESLIGNPYTKLVCPNEDIDPEELIKIVLNSQTNSNNSIPDLTDQISKLTTSYQDQVKAVRNQMILEYQSALEELQVPEDVIKEKENLTLPDEIRTAKQNQATIRSSSSHLSKQITAQTAKLEELKSATNCPTCGQTFDKEHLNHVQEQIDQINTELSGLSEELKSLTEQDKLLDGEIKQNEIELASILKEFKSLEDDLSEQRVALKKAHETSIEKIEAAQNLIQIKAEIAELTAKIADLKEVEQDRERAIDDATNFSDLLGQFAELTEKIEMLTESCDPKKNPDPFTGQIESLQKNALVDIKSIKDEIAKKKSIHEHYQLLINLATKPESFIRRQLIDMWLPVLNNRIAELLRQLELPHQVEFDSQMEMHISMLKSEYSNGNLSKGERSRLNVAINRAFQELFEVMNFRINLLVIDELIDNGICNRGAENAVQLLRDTVRQHDKRVFLITHRNDIQDKVDSILTVSKENDISTIKLE